MLHCSSPLGAATIAAFLRTRVHRPKSVVWLEGYQALIRWRTEGQITDVYALPYAVDVEVGATKAFPLGRWVHRQYLRTVPPLLSGLFFMGLAQPAGAAFPLLEPQAEWIADPIEGWSFCRRPRR